jgi:glutamate synthase (ferredoxin)
MERVEYKNDVDELRSIIEKHVLYTGSKKGQMILDNFDEYITHFKKIIPTDYKEMLRLTAECEEQGMNHEQAEVEAFTKLVG